MNQPELEPTPVTLDVRIADVSSLPLQHVNVVSIRFAKDEFFITLGLVMPPDPPEVAAAQQAGYFEAQPVFRFALSRDTMEKFLAIAAGQYDQQTKLIDRLNSPDDKKRRGRRK